MKKFILSLGLIAMAFGLTNCTKNEEVNPVVETKGDFAIYASTETRTANDGLNTVWATGDDMGVFHTVTNGTTYTKDGQFKLQDAATGQFLGNVNGTLDAEKVYDWYAMYPYSSYVPGPNNTSSGYMTIGCSASATQTQTGNNSMAHVAGKNFPLVGKAYAVPANQSPALAMTHVATLLEFEVTHSFEEAITVSNITFTAPSALVGTFYIDFDDISKISVASSGSGYTSKAATLIVKNGEAIEAGESAKFYLPVAPFVANANAKLSIEVNVTSGEKVGMLAKEITLTSETAFNAGKIRNIKVNYDAEFVEEGIALPFSDDFSWVTKDENGGTLSVSDLSSNYSAVSNVYGSVGELKFGASSTRGSLTTKPFDLSQPFTVVVDAMAYSTDTAQLTVTVNGVTKSSGNLVTGAYKKYVFEFDAATAASTIKFDITGKRGYIDNLEIVAGHDYVLPPVLTITSGGIIASYKGETATITYSVENPVEGVNATATADVDWIEDIDCSVGGEVSFTVLENTEEAIREGNITIVYGSVSETVVVTQAAKPGEGGSDVTEQSVTFDFTNISGFSSWGSSYGKHTVEYDDATVIFNSANKQGSTITNMPVTKGQPVEIKAKNGATMKAVKFTCKQWTTKAQTITLHYSINGGSSWNTTGKTSSNFSIEHTELPAGTNAVKITFSASGNQVGIQQADVTFLK
ncbi:MAG: hypothetical protein J6U73_00165 [Alistipes sp.]|nr:hypothetical protein [Alistipes sp.]